MQHNSSFFERIFARKHPYQVAIGMSIILICLLLVVVFLDGSWEKVFQQGQLRGLLLAPVIIGYIFFVSPIMMKMGDHVVDAMRPAIKLDDLRFDQILNESSQANPLRELGAFLFGFALGMVATLPDIFTSGLSWVGLYWLLTTGIMYGLLILTIYLSIASTRLVALLHRQPMEFDILDPTPFEPVGRQSLMLALVFIGGITISLLLSYQPESISSPDFWIVNVLFVLLTLIIFFLNMRPTHRTLLAEKRNRLAPVRQQINTTCQELVQIIERGQESGNMPAEILALETYEKRLQGARTWPYNTGILRTLFFSVLIPIGTLLVRLLFEILFR